MVKCPFCQFDNEDGVLFCEQCKSDLGGMAEPASMPMAEPVAAAGLAEPMTEPMEAAPIEAVPEPDATAPMAFAEPVVSAPPVEEPATPVQMPPITDPMTAAPQPFANAGAATGGPALATDAKPRLTVIRGVKIGVEYPLYDGENFIGRADEKPVDVDLEDQEPPDRVWSSRQHACIIYQDGQLTIEDLNSSNGTFVNRTRVYPGQKRPLNVNDVIQIGTVQMKLKA